MRIVNAMLGRGQGGMEQAFVDYGEALAFCGHEAVAVVHPGAAIIPALEPRNVPVHGPVYEIGNWGAWDPFAVARLRRLIARIQPDAVIAHGNRALSLLAAAKAPRLVAVLHNYKIKHQGARFVFYPTQDLLRHAQGEAEGAQHFYPVPNLVRVPSEPPARTVHAPAVIGCMGRFVAKKGFALFLEALAILKSKGLEFQAVLAGDGEEEGALKARAAATGLKDSVSFPGWVKDKQAFFDALDVFCLPSHHEPFGIVLLEAMAQALPVVATRSEGPSEILEGMPGGMLAPKNDASALADALAALLLDRRQALLLGRNAYDAVKSGYDLPVVARKLDLALRALCRL